jgi:hypothetical protein
MVDNAGFLDEFVASRIVCDAGQLASRQWLFRANRCPPSGATTNENKILWPISGGTLAAREVRNLVSCT